MTAVEHEAAEMEVKAAAAAWPAGVVMALLGGHPGLRGASRGARRARLHARHIVVRSEAERQPVTVFAAVESDTVTQASPLVSKGLASTEVHLMTSPIDIHSIEIMDALLRGISSI